MSKGNSILYLLILLGTKGVEPLGQEKATRIDQFGKCCPFT